MGEVNLLDPILAGLRDVSDDLDVVISTTTKTGYALARRKYASHMVFYGPLDFSWAVKNAFRRVRPDVLVLVELELWPNLLMEAKRRDIPVAIINGRLSERSARGYQRLKPFFRSWLSAVRLVTAQSATCADRFVAIGIPAERVHAVGSVKFDGARTDRANAMSQSLARLAGFQRSDGNSDADIVFLAGSTQAPEEACAIRVFQRLATEFPQLRLVVAPRHPERAAEVAKLLDRAGLPWIRRTQLTTPMADRRVLLIDTVGELVHGGLRGYWLRRGQHGQPRRTEYAGAGWSGRGDQLRAEHQEFPRRCVDVAR